MVVADKPTCGVDGKVRRIKDIRGVPMTFEVGGAVSVKQGNGKWLCLQRLQHLEPKRRVEYRFAYYMKGVKAGAEGRWVFGQYAMMIPPKLLKSLLTKAASEWPDFATLLRRAIK